MKQKKQSAFKSALITALIASALSYLVGRVLSIPLSTAVMAGALPVRTTYMAVNGIKGFLIMLIAAIICYKAVCKRKVPVGATVFFSLIVAAATGIVPQTRFYGRLMYVFQDAGMEIMNAARLMSVVGMVFNFLVFFLVGLVLFAATKPAVAPTAISGGGGISTNGTAVPVQPAQSARFEAPPSPSFGTSVADDDDDNNNNNFKYK